MRTKLLDLGRFDGIGGTGPVKLLDGGWLYPNPGPGIITDAGT